MDQNEQAASEAAVNEALTPSAADQGVSSPDTADETPESHVDTATREFLEKYGDDEPGQSGDSEDEAQESDSDPEAQKVESEQTPEEDQTDDADDEEFRIPDEQFKALPDGVKKRIGHLNARAKKAEREKAELEKNMVPLKDAHERFTQLQTFVRDNDIQPENVTIAFNAMAAMSKGDYQSFLDLVKPWYEVAQQALGAAIAPDLQQRVDDGYLSVEDAQALTRARVESQLSRGKVEAMTARQKEAAEQQAQHQAQLRILSAVQAREAELRSSDPDYAHKEKAMQSMIEFAMANGARPKNEQEALNIINDAYARVNATFTKPAPPKPTMPRPSASSSPRGTPAPANTYDLLMQASQDAD